MYIQTLLEKELTLWEEIGQYFRNYFEQMNSAEYENLGFGGSSMITGGGAGTGIGSHP